MSIIKKTYVYNLSDKRIDRPNLRKHDSLLRLYYGSQTDFPQDLNLIYNYLSNKEVERSRRFFHNADERTYIISHALVNKKISELLGKDFGTIKINYFENKKPYIEGNPFDFNLSHSSDYFAFAISGFINVYVGVDIEVVREDLDIEPIVNNYFHKNEISYILNSDSNNLNRQRRFYEVWTRKEAFLKMSGIGITKELAELDLTPGEREIKFHNDGFSNFNSCFNIFIYTLVLTGNLVLSLSINRSVSIITERCVRL